MKQLLFLSLAILYLHGLPGRAQVFRPGWVLPLQGDTLRGELEDASWNEEPTEVRFRTGPDGALVAYPGRTLQAFQVRGRQYFRREVLPLDRSARTRITELSLGLRGQQQPESVLAEVLVAGPATLLHLTLNEVRHYFVRRPGQPFVEVAERNYLRLQDGRRLIADGNNYQAVLHQYFGDCPAAVAASEHAPFTPAGLGSIVQAYNRQCDPARQAGAEFAGEPARQRFAANLGLVAGARYASYGLRANQDGAPLQGANFDGVLHPVGGAYLDVLFPARRGALHLAVLAANFGRDGTVPPATAGGGTGYLHGRQPMLEVRLGGRLLRPLGKQSAQLVLGTGLTLPVFLRDEASTVVSTDATTGTSRSSSAPDTYPSSIVPYLEAGVRTGLFTLTVEGRVSLSHYYDDFNLNLVNGSRNGYDYDVTPFYLGLSLGVALQHEH